MENYHGKLYCIQCVDKVSGKTGDFVHNGDFAAISPVFADCGEMFLYLHKLGYNTTDDFRVVSVNSNLR